MSGRSIKPTLHICKSRSVLIDEIISLCQKYTLELQDMVSSPSRSKTIELLAYTILYCRNNSYYRTIYVFPTVKYRKAQTIITDVYCQNILHLISSKLIKAYKNPFTNLKNLSIK